jgi:hypothetical protein
VATSLKFPDLLRLIDERSVAFQAAVHTYDAQLTGPGRVAVNV